MQTCMSRGQKFLSWKLKSFFCYKVVKNRLIKLKIGEFILFIDAHHWFNFQVDLITMKEMREVFRFQIFQNFPFSYFKKMPKIDFAIKSLIVMQNSKEIFCGNLFRILTIANSFRSLAQLSNMFLGSWKMQILYYSLAIFWLGSNNST